MDIRIIQQLIEIIDNSDVAEIEVCKSKESVKINRYSTLVPAPDAALARVAMPVVANAPKPAVVSAAAPVPAEQPQNNLSIKSPMVGTFYRASSTNAPLLLKSVKQFLSAKHCVLSKP